MQFNKYTHTHTHTYTERTGHRGRETGNGDGNRDGGEDGRKDEYENEHKGKDGGENLEEDGGEREPGSLRSCNRGESEDARRWATPASNQQPQLQDSISQRDRRIMLRAIVQEREEKDRIGEGGGEAKECKTPR